MESTFGDIASRRQLEFFSDCSDETNKETVDLDDDGGDKLTIEHHSSDFEERNPKIGMEFDTNEAAFKFYKEYAKLAGFGVRKHGVHKDISGKVLDRTFCCACQGYREKDKRDGNFVKHRPETRTGCRVMMKIDSRVTGKYKVVSFISEHNGHELVSPSKTHLLRSRRSITAEQAYQADDIDYSGIAPKVDGSTSGWTRKGWIYF